MKSVFSIVVVFATLMSQNVAAQFTLSCDSFCVLNVQMDTTPGMLAVTIQNNNAGHINYPTVQVLDSNGNWLAGDTVLNFFAQMGNSQQTYYIPTLLDSVPVGFTATIVLSEGIWDTLCFLPYPCVIEEPNGVHDISSAEAVVFPVPAGDELNVRMNETGGTLSLVDARGVCVMQRIGTSRTERIALTNFPAGMYCLRIVDASGRTVCKKVPVLR
jgi:hypothetical protein